jgi:hypothetical protein
MKTFRVLAVSVIGVLGVAARGAADECPLGGPPQFGAVAEAGGRIADGAEPGDCNIGPLFATAEQKYPMDNPETFYDSFAVANGSTLKARGKAMLSSTDFDFSVEGGAFASWGDVLRLDNPDVVLLDFLSNHPEVALAEFRPRVRGTVFNGSMEFKAYLTDENGDVFVEDVIEASTEGHTGQPPDPLPPDPSNPDIFHTLDSLHLVFPLEQFLDGILFHMELDVTAVATEEGRMALTDYSHTAFLPTIRIVDPQGNLIPELAGVSVQFVGSSGITYAGSTTVPEPATATIVAIAMLLVTSVSRRRWE